MLFCDDSTRARQTVVISMRELYQIIHDRFLYSPDFTGDVDAATQNVCVAVEKNMGIYPNVNGVEHDDRRSVMQRWTHNLTRMQQTVLLTAVRGPDGLPKYGGVKMLLRWYRRCILVSSLDNCIIRTPFHKQGGSFMGPSYDGESPEHLGRDWRWSMDNIMSSYLKELDAIPHHFQLHMLHSFEIVGYKHPDSIIRNWFYLAYVRLVEDMHLSPETEERLDFRLSDNRDNWLSTADTATQD